MNKFDSFRIGKQGKFFEGGFKFKARSDCDEVLIDKNFSYDTTIDKNQIAQILMFRFIDSYLRAFDVHLSRYLPQYLDILLSVDEGHDSYKISWDPMVAGTRLLKYLYIRHELSRFLENSMKDKIDERIIYTIDRLSSIKYYNNNHYLQGLHALVAAAFLEKRTDLNKFKDLAISMFTELFNEEGFYKENSSEYHFYAIKMLKDFDSCGWYDSKILKDILCRAEDFNSILFAADGEVFAFGDTDRSLIKRQVRSKDIVIKDIPLLNKVNVKPSTGLARSSSSDSNWASDVMFVNFYHGPSHNHHDYCSFEWFVNGSWVLMDPGKFSYNSDERSSYFYTDKAHNTINFSFFGHDYKESIKYVSGNESDGFNEIYGEIIDKNFCFSRLIKHGPSFLNIKDSLIFQKAKRTPKVISSINIAPAFTDINKISDTEIIFFSKEFKLVATSNYKLDAIFGCESPFFGWVSDSYNVSVPCWYLYSDISTTSNIIEAELKINIYKY